MSIATVRTALRPKATVFASAIRLNISHQTIRNVNMASMASMNSMSAMSAMPPPANKRVGDISDSFASLSGFDAAPLPDRYRELKLSLVAGVDEATFVASWQRLLAELRAENETIARLGPDVIPSIRYSHLDEDLATHREELHKRGVAVVRGVIPETEARAYKDQVEAYVALNKDKTHGFPPENPQVIELYWSAAQLAARGHPNLVSTQKRLLGLWHADPSAGVDLDQLTTYADRLRIRLPGDARFALGPHQDGGSVERWENKGYGLGKVYDSIFAGKWEDYDAWDAGSRSTAVIDLHAGLGACSAFRAFQGWLSISHVGPNQGTLLVYPLAKLATAYTLLRPFFKPVKPAAVAGNNFLDADNWVFTSGAAMTSDLQGATPGHGQEFPDGSEGSLHPHLELARTMVHVPQVKPGDYVVWHCDGIHAVDKVHRGTSDSSVLYIPVCPLTEPNARFLVRQREAFIAGLPGPDFPGGPGESSHAKRPTPDAVEGETQRRAMGLEPFVAGAEAGSGARAVTEVANSILGF